MSDMDTDKTNTGLACRIVVLDSYDISTIEGRSGENTERARALLAEHNPNDFTTFGVEWSKGLEGTSRRFMPYNGMLSEDQLLWLEERLAKSAQEKETVVVLCHVPLHPRAADNLCLLWNYQVNPGMNIHIYFSNFSHSSLCWTS